MDGASSYILLRGFLLVMKRRFSVSVREPLIRVGPRTEVSQEALVHPCCCCCQMHLCVLALHSEAKQVRTRQCGAEKGLLQGHVRRQVSGSCLKNPELPESFQQSPFIRKMKEKEGHGCACMLSCSVVSDSLQPYGL